MKFFIIVLAALLVIAGLNPACAQQQPLIPGQAGRGASQPLNPSTPNMAIYNVMRGGEIQIDINLWGYVGSPGHYRVPGSTSLVELLSFAGGPTAQARLVDIRIIHAD